MLQQPCEEEWREMEFLDLQKTQAVNCQTSHDPQLPSARHLSASPVSVSQQGFEMHVPSTEQRCWHIDTSLKAAPIWKAPKWRRVSIEIFSRQNRFSNLPTGMLLIPQDAIFCVAQRPRAWIFVALRLFCKKPALGPECRELRSQTPARIFKLRFPNQH